MERPDHLYWTAAGTAALGCLLGWSFSGGTPGIDWTKTDTLNLLSAAGTWAVGIGAFHYARAAHQLRQLEIKKQLEEKLDRLQSSYELLRGRVKTFRIPARNFTHGDLAPATIKEPAIMQMVVGEIARQVPKTDLFEALGILAQPDIVNAAYRLQKSGERMSRLCVEIGVLLKESNGVVTNRQRKQHERLADCCNVAKGRADDLLSLLQERHVQMVDAMKR